MSERISAVKSRLSDFFKKGKRKSTPPPPVVVVAPMPIVVGRAVAPQVEFEIGGDEENEFGQVVEERRSDDFSSVDLSPSETKSHTNPPLFQSASPGRPESPL